jgi:hypothetical protein
MNNEAPKELTIFFTALAAVAIIFVGGFEYLQGNPGQNSSGLLADIGSVVPAQSQDQVPQTPAVETIPTDTIVTASTSVSAGSAATPSSTQPITLPLTLPYSFSAKTANETYWPKAWGGISLSDNALALIPDPGYHGANSFLQGASSWSDYAASANVSWLMGGWFDIVARVSNNTQNFVYCEFGPNGTEVIERVNGTDTQLALTSASTTANVQGTTDNFGIEVYKTAIACTMNGQEVVGAQVKNTDEAPAGGIGFVIFGAPQEQKQVEVTNIHAVALSSDPIIVPFPLAIVPPPPAPAPAPTPAPVTPPAQPTPPAPAPAPVPVVVATTTKTIPYSQDTFATGDGWGNYWGTFSETPRSLLISANSSIPTGGAFLNGTESWDNYTFTANLDWIKGEVFGMYARHTDSNNYVECVFDRRYLGDVQISLQQFVNGTEHTLTQTDLSGYNQSSILNFDASIEVQDTVGTCTFDGHTITNAAVGNTIAPPYSGKIGFTTWDPNSNNSEIIVKSVSVKANY